MLGVKNSRIIYDLISTLWTKSKIYGMALLHNPDKKNWCDGDH